MAYSDKVVDHYENPRNVGKFEIDDTTGTGMVGTSMKLSDIEMLQIEPSSYCNARCPH